MCNCGGSKKAGAAGSVPAGSRPIGPTAPSYFWNGPKQQGSTPKAEKPAS